MPKPLTPTQTLAHKRKLKAEQMARYRAKASTTYTPFQRWWLSVNKVLWSRDLPEMNFAEAQAGYETFKNLGGPVS